MLRRGGGDERDLVIHHLLQRSGLLGECPVGVQDHLFVPHGVGRENALHELLGSSLILGDEAGREVAPDQHELLAVGGLGSDLAIVLEHGIEVGEIVSSSDSEDGLVALLVEHGEHGGDFGFGLHSQFLVMSDE